MAVEDSADLAGFFEEDEFAEAASYSAPGGGSPVDCLVILDRGQGRRKFDAGTAQVQTSERKLWVRASEVTPAKGGVFTIAADSEQLAVAAAPELDHTASVWSVELLIRS